MATNWEDEDLEVVFYRVLCCPHCRAERPILIRSEKRACGDQVQKRICRKCSEPFKVILEKHGEEFDAAEFRQDDF